MGVTEGSEEHLPAWQVEAEVDPVHQAEPVTLDEVELPDVSVTGCEAEEEEMFPTMVLREPLE